MKTTTKYLIIAGVAVIIIVTVYFIYKKREEKKPRVGAYVPGATPEGGRIAVRSIEPIMTTTGTDRWIVKGDKPQGQHCPMGQSEIWDGTKWVCAVRSADEK
jgi:hypothetical protein